MGALLDMRQLALTSLALFQIVAAASYAEPAGFDPRAALSSLGIEISACGNASIAGECAVACSALEDRFGSQVSFPNQSTYGLELSGFWSLQQADTRPACIFRPGCAEDVAAAVLTSRVTGCPFAAKSGGHAAFAGASNIQGGVTVDFAEMNEVTVSEDKKTVALGPGNTWYDVYSKLSPMNLTVIGGRVAAIGVGGLTLGGGISFFSGRYGWACDNVESYEVVTASGDIVTASTSTNPDLYWALRGGGNNFGLVTRFDAYAYDHGLMWGGNLVHLAAQNASLIEAFIEFGVNGSVADPDAALILSFAYVQAEDIYISATSLEYAQPQAAGSHPAVFDCFFAVPGAVEDTTTTQSLENITLEFNASNPGGLRESYWAATFRFSSADTDGDDNGAQARGLVAQILDIWAQEVGPLQNVTGVVPALTLQVITVPQLQAMERNGGNALGIDGGKGGPLLLVNPNIMWADPAADDLVLTAWGNVVSQSVAWAEDRGLDHPYVYMNYASQFQDPIAGYGAANKARLVEIAQRYDPEGVFQSLQPGYFKLDGLPATGP